MNLKKIQQYLDSKSHVKIVRAIGDNNEKNTRGYILNFSSDFLLLQETDNFQLMGYVIMPISKIKKIKCGKNEKYYTKIMKWEGEAEKTGINYKIDLNDWQSMLNSVKNTNLNVIVECEAPDIDTFTIGPILKITRKKVYILYFDAAGYIDEDPVKINFDDITKLTFDDRYINIFSKYLRKK